MLVEKSEIGTTSNSKTASVNFAALEICLNLFKMTSKVS